MTISNSNLYHFMNVRSVRVNPSNIAVRDASNKTGSKPINLSVLVRCQRLETLSCYLMFKELKLLHLLLKKQMMRAVLLLNRRSQSNYYQTSLWMILSLSKRKKPIWAKVVMVKSNLQFIKQQEFRQPLKRLKKQVCHRIR